MFWTDWIYKNIDSINSLQTKAENARSAAQCPACGSAAGCAARPWPCAKSWAGNPEVAACPPPPARPWRRWSHRSTVARPRWTDARMRCWNRCLLILGGGRRREPRAPQRRSAWTSTRVWQASGAAQRWSHAARPVGSEQSTGLRMQFWRV